MISNDHSQFSLDGVQDKQVGKETLKLRKYVNDIIYKYENIQFHYFFYIQNKKKTN